MGPAYEPLPPDDPLRPSVGTPFGPSLNYRSQSIAAVIAWYYAACKSHKSIHSADGRNMSLEGAVVD